MKNATYYFVFVALLVVSASCSSIHPLLEDDVYMMKSADLPVGENLLDETSYATYKYRAGIDQKADQYYEPSRESVFGPQNRLLFRPAFIFMGGVGFYNINSPLYPYGVGGGGLTGLTTDNNYEFWLNMKLYGSSFNGYTPSGYYAGFNYNSHLSNSIYQPRGTAFGVYSGNNRIPSNYVVNSPTVPNKPYHTEAKAVRTATTVGSNRGDYSSAKPGTTRPPSTKPTYTRPVSVRTSSGGARIISPSGITRGGSGGNSPSIKRPTSSPGGRPSGGTGGAVKSGGSARPSGGRNL
jgi:hypothetical protein